jgi:hypothetical protein
VHIHFLSHQRTVQLGDKQVGRLGIVFGVLRVGEAKYVSGVFNYDVLEATACADKRQIFFPSKANRIQGTS